MRYELLDGTTVVNSIEADADFMAAHYAANKYRAAAQAPEAQPVWAWYIDIGPFFDRMGAAKMPVLVSQDATVRALIADLQVRKWVDLNRSDVAQGLAYVGAVVAALTPALQAQVITTPVTAEENMALRKLYFGA